LLLEDESSPIPVDEPQSSDLAALVPAEEPEVGVVRSTQFRSQDGL
jgi:hypothetical protein